LVFSQIIRLKPANRLQLARLPATAPVALAAGRLPLSIVGFKHPIHGRRTVIGRIHTSLPASVVPTVGHLDQSIKCLFSFYEILHYPLWAETGKLVEAMTQLLPASLCA
jgi:hypothetical protein